MKDAAKAEKWDSLLDKKVSDTVKYDGNYVAVPVNIHRVNWLWINPEVFKKAGIEKAPTTLQEFYAAGDKLKAAGFIALAHGGQPWQDSTVFEAVVLSVMGVDGYKKALVDLDNAALTGPDMVKALTELKKVATYMDADGKGQTGTWRRPRSSTARPACRSWVTGPRASGQRPRKSLARITVRSLPGTDKAFTYNIDSLAVFKQKDKGTAAAQQDIAKIVLGENFQKVFSINKGSIPVRNDMLSDMGKYGFDSCAQTAAKDFWRTPRPVACSRAWRTTWRPRWRYRVLSLMS